MKVHFYTTVRDDADERRARKRIGGRARCSVDPFTGKIHSVLSPLGRAISRRNRQICNWYRDAMKWRSQREQSARLIMSDTYTTGSGGAAVFAAGFTVGGVEFVRKTPLDESPE